MKRPPLGIRAIVAAAARDGVRHWKPIVAVAVVVGSVTTLAGILVEDFVERADVPVTVFADLTASAVSLVGAVFLSGFLCRLVGGAERGDDDEVTPVREIWLTLPWARLIGADLLVALLFAAGLLALVIPGLVVANLLAIVGPVIEIEDRRVIAALRRSAHLVRPYFWPVALLVLLPVTAAGAIDSFSPDRASVRGVLETLAVRGLGGGLAEAAIGLIVVKLAGRIISLDRAPWPARAARRPPGRDRRA